MTTKVTDDVPEQSGSANTESLRELAQEAQSEAPSVDILDEIFAPLIDSPNLTLTSVYWKEAKTKINRLIIEAELRGFDKAFDSHDYDGLREYRVALSNNLSKGDGK